ncbi:MAG: response regulator [Cyclobacteriaceae bacterium]
MEVLKVLLIEDNEGDILLISEALKELKVPVDFFYLRDGHDAVEFFKRCVSGLEEKVPDLVLLDINLPKKNGQEVLSFIKNSPGLKQVPVIMMTTSSSHKDVWQAYENHANCYIMKPIGGSNYQEIVEKIEEFWFSLARLPTKL